MAAPKKRKKKRLKPSQQYTAKRNAQIEEAMDYAIQGAEYRQIAETMKITEQEVIELIDDGIRKVTHGAISQVHDDALEILRLDRMIQAVLPTALTGDEAARKQYDKLKRDRRRLYDKVNPRPTFFGTIRVPTGEAGQPPHVATAETIAIVEALVFNGHTQEEISKWLKISVETLIKHYGDLLEGGKAFVIAEVAAGVFRIIRNNEPGAIPYRPFVLRTQAGWSEFERPRGENAPQSSGTGGLYGKHELIITGGLPPDDVDATPLPPVDTTDEEGDA